MNCGKQFLPFENKLDHLLREIKELPDPELLNRLAREGKIDYFHRKLPLVNFFKLKDNNPFILNSLIENDSLLEKIPPNEVHRYKRLVDNLKETNKNKNRNNIQINKNNNREVNSQKPKHQQQTSSNTHNNNINNNIHYDDQIQDTISNRHNIVQLRIKGKIINGIMLEKNQIQCVISGCKKKFDNKYKLNYHLGTHSNDKTFLCDIDDCKKEFKRKQTLNRHVRSFHKKTTRFQCKICSVCFAYPQCNR